MTIQAPHLNAYFDTKVGHKRDSGSYSKCSKTLQIRAAEILFLSDAPEELEAAVLAGLSTCHVLRPGNRELQIQAHDFLFLKVKV